MATLDEWLQYAERNGEPYWNEKTHVWTIPIKIFNHLGKFEVIMPDVLPTYEVTQEWQMPAEMLAELEELKKQIESERNDHNGLNQES